MPAACAWQSPPDLLRFGVATADAPAPNDPKPLTKTEYLSGAQCLRQLWWRRHEPGAVELQPDRVLQDLFDQGQQVGALARERFPGGVLVPAAMSREDRTRRTAEAIDAGATVLFEAAFLADGVFVVCDVLVREPDGWHLIEVKSASRRKDEHLHDLAVQAHVLARAGLAVTRLGVMHLNPEFAHPDGGDLFARADVTALARAHTSDVPAQIEAQRAALAGPLPASPIGLHCAEPWECAFKERCWPADPWHIGRLHGVGAKRADQWMRSGVTDMRQLPEKALANPTVRRQLTAMVRGTRIVERSLHHALAPFDERPLGFLDFETVARAVPVWPAMSPWEMAAAQFSYHELGPDGSVRHEEHLAEGPEDARPLVARRLVDATRHAARIVTYSSFEKSRIRALQLAVPALAPELAALEAKLVDLLPVVREHVYDPAFLGSFSLKTVLPALVPDLSYQDLVIVDGRLASVEIARLLFVADRIPLAERDRVRRDLLAYCERDTWAMVRLLEVLRGLAGR